MLKPTLDEAQEFMRLRRSPAHAYLERVYGELRELLVHQNDELYVRRIQGQAQMARKLLEMIDPEGLSTSGKRG